MPIRIFDQLTSLPGRIKARLKNSVTSPIDIKFYFPSDAGGGDPDRTSPTLRRYHKLLWSKPLPDGRHFDLDDSTPGVYLHHKSEAVGEFFLSSDSVIHTFRDWKRLAPVIKMVPKDAIDRFYRLAYSIGAMLVYPANKVDGMMTINGARGFNQLICDRLDLTLECVRRHYVEIESPLSDTLDRYRSFFDLFGDFYGYVDFFLLEDLVATDQLEVRYFTDDFNNFSSSPLPREIATYRTYMQRSIEFVNARNVRILEWVRSRVGPN